jgi:hypothetical protein
MWIDRSVFRENNRTGDWFVDGEIYIKGEFTRQEWEHIKQAFIALGLHQLGGKCKLSNHYPRRSEVVDAIMMDARNLNNEAMKQLKKKYPLLLTDDQSKA